MMSKQVPAHKPAVSFIKATPLKQDAMVLVHQHGERGVPCCNRPTAFRAQLALAVMDRPGPRLPPPHNPPGGASEAKCL